MSRMRRIMVNLSDRQSKTGASVKTESGANWGQVYEELEKYKKITVGSGFNNVCIAGHTLGGGVSILSRSYGLAIDNIIEFDIVLHNGTKARCSKKKTVFWEYNGLKIKSKNTDLFWSVLGGGGGSFGVVISFTYIIYDAPKSFVRYEAAYTFDIIDNKHMTTEIAKFLLNFLYSLKPKWGAYLAINELVPLSSPDQIERVSDNNDVTDDNVSYEDLVKTYIDVILLYNGEWDDEARSTYRKLENFYPNLRLHEDLKNFTSYLAYSKVIEYPDTRSMFLMSANLKLNVSNNELLDLFVTHLKSRRLINLETSCLMTLIGGKINDVSPEMTPIHPALRSSHLIASCDIHWEEELFYAAAVEESASLAGVLADLGESSYWNEAYIFDENWQERYWGSNYPRLLKLKQQIDPHNIFTCRHCVGQELISSS